MENRRFDPEEQDDSTPEASNKKKRGGSRLSQYLSVLRGKEDKESSETTTEKGDEKPKKFRRLFSRLFPSVVEKPDGNDTESKDYGFDPEAWFGITGFGRSVESSDTNEPEQVEALTGQDTPEQSVTSDAEKTPDAPVESVEAPAVATPETPVEAEPVISEIQQATPSEGELFIRHQEQPEVPQAATTPEETTKEKEVVIERGPGMVLPVALVGLEHLGRKKADKKLEKRVNEKITATNTEVSRNAGLQQELETLTRQNSEQLEALKRAREGRALEAMQAAKEAVEPVSVARPERIITVEQPKVTPEKAEPAPEFKERPAVVVEKAEKGAIQPERILEQIADAAEQDLPVERIFERSHEVKDDNTVPVGAATPIGAVISSQPVVSQYQSIHQGPPPITIQNDTPVVIDEVARATYMQAVKLGFWVAIMIIILGSIAYLMVK
jgi:hypothetical protein